MAGDTPVVVEGSRAGRKVAAQEDDGAAAAAGSSLPSQDGFRGATRALVPGSFANAGARRASGRTTRRYRFFRPALPLAAAGSTSIGCPGPQRAAVDAAHVRRFPAQRPGCAN